MDRLTFILTAAGLGCFILAFLLSGVYPYLITDAEEPEATVLEVTRDVSPHFKEMKDSYPVVFRKAFGDKTDVMLTPVEIAELPESPEKAETIRKSDEAWNAAYAMAVQKGRNIYIGEACWHCHSQYVRPVSNEEQRFGPVLSARHYNNALQRPVMFGTRRVGPDLTHEGGKRTNDWHVAHFWDPQSTSPDSIMPRFVWYTREGYQVRRYVSEETADQQGLPLDHSNPVAGRMPIEVDGEARSVRLSGIYDTEQEAKAAIALVQENPPANLESEMERLFVGKGRGPNEEGLMLIAYIQWLGTWNPSEEPRK